MRSAASHPLPKVALVSRCAWTLHNFRRPLMRAVQANGMELALFGDGSDGYDDLLRRDALPFEHVPMGRGPFWRLDDAGLFVNLYRRFRAVAPSIVHSFTARPAVFATLAATSAGVPARVVTVTGLGHAFTTAGARTRAAVESLYRLALRFADVVFFQNQDDRELFLERKLVSAQATRLVPGSGVDVDHFGPARLPHIDRTHVTILMLGRVLREKGVYEYFEAARRLRDRRDVTFRLVGGLDARNPSSLTRHEAASLARDSGVEWIDHVLDVRPYIAAADVVVLPSYREGLPRSLLEAGSMARPLVACDTPGCREVVESGTNGRLVPVADAPALADAFIDLLSRRESLEEMGRESRRLVKGRFDQRIVLEQTIRAYQYLLATKVVGVRGGNSEAEHAVATTGPERTRAPERH